MSETSTKTKPIAVWPDGQWCFWKYAHGMGDMDDVAPSLVQVPEEYDIDQIDEFVFNRMRSSK